jgi:arylsulfatase A-like enzyme
MCSRNRRCSIARRGRLLPAALLVLLPLASCHRPVEQPSLIRLIDLLERENVVESPLQRLASDRSGFGRENPNLARLADKYPLLDAGAGRNPFLVKKKIQVGPGEENALLAFPRSVFRFRLRIASGSRLELRVAVLRGRDKARGSGLGESVDFSVRRLEEGVPESLVYQRTLTLPPGRDLVLDSRKVDLAPSGDREVVLEFTTRGTEDLPAFWLNPLIVQPRTPTRPIILISLDTLRADHVGCYGYDRATTPNIDRLAADSVLFRNTFAPSPWTLPSHVSMLTGLDCLHHGVYHTEDRMDPELPTLADYLREHGYLTSAFTGDGFVIGLYGFSKGFDTFRPHPPGSNPSLESGALARNALAWLETNADRDFLLFLHTYQMHDPYVPPPPYDTMFLDPGAELRGISMADRRYNYENRYKPPDSEAFRRNVVALYDGEIRYTDEVLIGPLVRRLKELGLYDRALIVLTSDHGEEFYEKGSWLHQASLYDQSLKVPLLVKFPGSRDGGRRIDRWARLTDILPTVLEESGLEFPARDLDGKSLRSLVGGREKGPQRAFRSELAADVVKNHVPRKRAVSQGTYKVILNDDFQPRDLAFFAHPPPKPERLEIYDLAEDPGETRNLALSRPELARRMLSLLDQRFKPTRRTRKPAGTTPEMSREIREELKALGYIR